MVFIEIFSIGLLDISYQIDEIQNLSLTYIEKGIIPRRKIEDALHIAIATVKELDILLSWNYKHLANINKEIRIRAINLLAGYSKPIRFLTPMEVVYEDD